MVDFSQKSANITTFHILRDDPKHLRNQIRLHSRWKKTVLVIPLLASEYTDPANLPVFENILKQLRDVNYLSTIIFGLDRATEAEAFRLRDLIQRFGIRHYLIQWNDGPGFSGIYDQLNEAGFNISEPGKGKNMFLSFGIAMALGSHSIGLIDADIRTFRRVQLHRLLLSGGGAELRLFQGLLCQAFGRADVRPCETAPSGSPSPGTQAEVHREPG